MRPGSSTCVTRLFAAEVRARFLLFVVKIFLFHSGPRQQGGAADAERAEDRRESEEDPAAVPGAARAAVLAEDGQQVTRRVLQF